MTNSKSLIAAACVVFAITLGGCMPQKGDPNSQDGNSLTVAGEVIYKWDDDSLCTIEVGEPLTKKEWNKNPLSQEILLEGEYLVYKTNVLEDKYMPKDKEKGDYATPVTWRIPGKHIEGIDANGTHPMLVLDNTPKGFILPYAKPAKIKAWVEKLQDQIKAQETDELVQAKKDIEANNSNVKALQDKIASLKQDVKEKDESLSKAQEEKKASASKAQTEKEAQDKKIAELEEKTAMFKSGDKGTLIISLAQEEYIGLGIATGLLILVLILIVVFVRKIRTIIIMGLRDLLDEMEKSLKDHKKRIVSLEGAVLDKNTEIMRLRDIEQEIKKERKASLDRRQDLQDRIASLSKEIIALKYQALMLLSSHTQLKEESEALYGQTEEAKEKEDCAVRGLGEAKTALTLAQETVGNTLKGLGVPDEHEKPIGPPDTGDDDDEATGSTHDN